MRKTIIFLMNFMMAAMVTHAQEFETDVIETSAGNLEITFIGHGTLMMKFGEKIIHIDPVSQYADYQSMPKADLVLITHEHGDHLDPSAINAVKKKVPVSFSPKPV